MALTLGKEIECVELSEDRLLLRPIGLVRSSLEDLSEAPLQGDEGAPEAWLEIEEEMAPALAGLSAGDSLLVLTWLHEAARDVLVVHPRGNPLTPPKGVFATRSPDRPNPIGLHPVSLLEIAGRRLRVAPLEAIDGTPVLDIKPVLENRGER